MVTAEQIGIKLKECKRVFEFEFSIVNEPKVFTYAFLMYFHYHLHERNHGIR